MTKAIIKKTLSNKRIRAFTISLLFLLSGIGASVLISPVSAATNAPRASLAAPLSQAQANWITGNGNQFNQDYNPQTQINSSSAQYLGLNWIFPLPGRPPALANFVGTFFTGLGVDTAPTIVNGTAYVDTQSDQVYALNAATGAVIWNTIIPVQLNSSAGTGSSLQLHKHDGAVRWTSGTGKVFPGVPHVWFEGADLKIYAINAITGKIDLNFTDFSGISGAGVGGIQGNSPGSFYAKVGATNMLVDEARGIVITSSTAELAGANARCFFKGWNVLVSPPQNIWTSYCTPPQHGSTIGADPMWTINTINSMKSMEIFFPGVTATNGYVTPQEHAGGALQNVNYNASVQLKNLTPAQLNATLYDDWGQANQSSQCAAITGGGSTGSTGAGWGGGWLLGSGPTSGMAFLATNNKDPYSGPCTPGPDLCSACLMAIDEATGQWQWWFQANAHDLWDYDCSWYQAAGNQTINGVLTPVIYKTCKAGYMFEINALTGHLIWSFNPLQSVSPRCAECYMFNPLNRTQMLMDCASQVFQTHTANFNPYGPCPDFLASPFTAGFEDEQSFNPSLNMLFAASETAPNFIHYTGQNATTYRAVDLTAAGMTFTPVNRGTCANCNPTNNNASIWGIDAATGAPKWHYFIPLLGYRGGVATTADLAIATLSSGHMLFINANNGNLVRDFYVGGPLTVLPSIGATASGQNILIFPISSSGTSPGNLLSLSLQGVAAGGNTQTVTSTQTTTTTTTTTAAATTITTTINGVVSTITTTISGTGSAMTQTVTSTTGGTSTTTLYGVAAVAVIFIITTGYLTMRGRKPAS